MAMHGGKTPYDEAGALTGPARILYAPIATAVPTDIWDVIPAINTSGEYAAKTGWFDFGLAADAPQYTASRESTGLEYQQPSGSLFQAISSITRSITVQVAHIDEKTLQIIENAATASTIAAAANESALKKVNTGLYSSVPQWRICMIAFRPSGAGTVTEPDATTRPPLVARIIPRATITSDDTTVEISKGDPTNTSVTFIAESEPTAAAGAEHGYWIVEQTGTITP